MPLFSRKIILILLLVTVGFLYQFSSRSPRYYTGTASPYAASDDDDMGSLAQPQRPLRVAILLNDTPQPKTNEKYGGYLGVFKALLDSACQSLDPPQEVSQQMTLTGHDVVNDLDSYPSLDDVDALLLTGSKHDSFRDDPWILKLVEYTKKALDSGRIKVVGVCFGHQIIARAVGTEVGRSDRGWEIAVTEVDLTEKGKEVFGMEKMRIHQMHHDIAYEFPKESIPLGGNEVCPVQGMYVPGKYITVQGHPEFTDDIITEVITNRHNGGVFDDELYEDGMKRAPLPHDGVAIARTFIKFMREG